MTRRSPTGACPIDPAGGTFASTLHICISTPAARPRSAVPSPPHLLHQLRQLPQGGVHPGVHVDAALGLLGAAGRGGGDTGGAGWGGGWGTCASGCAGLRQLLCCFSIHSPPQPAARTLPRVAKSSMRWWPPPLTKTRSSSGHVLVRSTTTGGGRGGPMPMPGGPPPPPRGPSPRKPSGPPRNGGRPPPPLPPPPLPPYPPRPKGGPPRRSKSPPPPPLQSKSPGRMCAAEGEGCRPQAAAPDRCRGRSRCFACALAAAAFCARAAAFDTRLLGLQEGSGSVQQQCLQGSRLVNARLLAFQCGKRGRRRIRDLICCRGCLLSASVSVLKMLP